VKLESENKEYERARLLLNKARDRAGTARVWMKSAKLERKLGDRDKEEKLLTQALTKFPDYPKLYIMMAQLLTDSHKKYDTAREIYKRGVKNCPAAIDLWICYAKFEALVFQAYSKARSILETARLKNPKNSRLWLAAMRVERQAKNFKVAQQLLAKALQECPDSGILWAYAIATDPRPVRKARSYDALKRCTDDPHVFCAVAKLFWLDRKVRKARNWFNRAVTVQPDLGDAWAYFYKFELEHGNTQRQEAVVKRCVEADPRHGELWQAVSKEDENSSLKTDEVLHKVVASIKDVFQEV